MWGQRRKLCLSQARALRGWPELAPKSCPMCAYNQCRFRELAGRWAEWSLQHEPAPSACTDPSCFPRPTPPCSAGHALSLPELGLSPAGLHLLENPAHRLDPALWEAVGWHIVSCLLPRL